MSNANRLFDAQAIRNFLFAGNAVFTLVSKVTGTRFTYKLNVAETGGKTFFLCIRDLNRWEFLGSVHYRITYKHSQKSEKLSTETYVKAFEWFLSKIVNDEILDNMEFWHEGQCGACGRPLTVPDSIKRGIGPECRRSLNAGY